MATFRTYTYETEGDPETGEFRVYEIHREAVTDGTPWRVSARDGGAAFRGWKTIGVCSTKRAADRLVMLVEAEARRKVDL